MSHELMKPSSQDDVNNYHRKSVEKDSDERDSSKDTYSDSGSFESEYSEHNEMINEAECNEDEEDQAEEVPATENSVPTIRVGKIAIND